MSSASLGGQFLRRRRHSQPVVLILGIVCVFSIALGLILLVLFQPRSEPEVTTVVVERAADPQMIDVLVPVREVEAGSELRPELFRRESRPVAAIGPRTIRTVEELHGHYARAVLLPGQPLHRDVMTSVKPASPITAAIPAGYRAVAISVDAKSSVEGWARPGAKVDVTWASSIRGQAGVSVIVQNARILSAERDVETHNASGKAIPATVTLLVPADDASRIQLASSTGTLNLSLRGDSDRGRGGPLRSLTTSDLLGGSTPIKSGDQGPVVKIRNKNGSVEEYKFDNGKLSPYLPADN